MSYDFEALLADPGTEWAGPRREREAFRSWAGARFDSWYKRGHALAEAKDNDGDGRCEGGGEVEFFESCWYPGGPEAYSRLKEAERQSDAIRAARTRAFRYVFDLIISRLANPQVAELAAQIGELRVLMDDPAAEFLEVAVQRLYAGLQRQLAEALESCPPFPNADLAAVLTAVAEAMTDPE